MEPLEWLPMEVLQHLLNFLDVKELILMGMVSKTFRIIHTDEILWKQLMKRKWPMIFNSLIGPQSRWNFTSRASKMLLYYMDVNDKKQKSENTNYELYDMELLDWCNQRNRKKIKFLFEDLEDEIKERLEKVNNCESNCSYPIKTNFTQLPIIRYEIATIINVMRKYSKDNRIQQEICYMFRRLCYQSADVNNDYLSNLNQALIAQEGGLVLIIELMRNNPLDEEVQMEAAAALINLALNDKNKEIIAQLEGIKVLILAMKMYQDNPNVQQFCCSVIWNLACSDSNLDIISKEGGIQLVLGCMKKYPCEVKLQAKACGALRNITRNHEINRAQVVKEGGVQLILAAIKNHKKNISVQQEALRTLYNIARSVNNTDMLNEGIILIKEIMFEHKNNANIQYEGCMALAGLSYGENKDLTDGGIQLVINAMVNHQNNPEIQKIGTAVLADLSLNPKNEDFILGIGGFKLMVEAMKRFPKNIHLQETLCSALADLTRKAPQVECIMKENGVEALISAVRNFQNNETIAKFAVATLKNLSSVSVANKNEIIEKGGMQYIL